jgi:flagellar biosynthesis protein FlhF
MHDTTTATAPSLHPHSDSRAASMKIKRFVAADMRTAMNLVRKEHGPDAVILSNRRIEEGVEIVAAAHYDESAVQRALEAARPAPAAAPRPRSAAEAIMAAVTRRKAPETGTEPVAATTSAVAELARSAVGATGRSIDSSLELAPGSRFPAQPRPQPKAPVAAVPEQVFANFLGNAEAATALPPRETIAAASAPTPVNRARFVIDPPLEEPAPAPQAAAPVQPEVAPVQMSEPATPALSVVASAPRDDEQLTQLRQEMTGMRQLIEREMHRLNDERLRGNPVRASALDLMDEYGFDAGLARDVVMQIPADTDPARARGLMLGLISKQLPITPIDPIETGGVIALVGPTGAGKTTTIAKLASRFAETHAPRDVALVTTDTQRIGAREQLYGFGRQLGIAVHEAHSGTNLNQLLERLADYKLVLIDTAGLGQRDRALTAQLQWLRAAGQIRTLLVLPANTAFQDMDEVVRRFGAANPQGLVLTKLDETGRLGSALSVAVDHHLPITWVTDGQDVPEDLHRASAANLVLRLEDLRRAADMPCSTPELTDAVA